MIAVRHMHPNIDVIVDEVRVETSSALDKMEQAAHAACVSSETKAAAREARPNLDIATLNHQHTFQPNDHMDVPFALWDGSEVEASSSWVPHQLYDEGENWRVTHTLYSSGVCEIRASLGKPPTRKPGNVSSPSTIGETSPQDQDKRFQSSIDRSRKTLRMRATELAADHLMTLTKRGKFESIDAFWKTWERMCRLASIRFKHWKFVVVPEQHKDGTYHAHVALQGYYSVEALRICWYKALGGIGNERGENTPGSVNIKRFHKPRESRPRSSTVRIIAAYISKYVGKGFGASDRGRRLFAAARGLAPYRVVKRISHHRGGLTELAAGLLGELFAGGATGDGEVFKWSRMRSEGSMQMCGFILSTDWKVPT